METNLLSLKRRLYHKIDSIQDADYLASLDAVLTYETAPAQTSASQQQRPFWRRLWLWLAPLQLR